MSKPSSGIETDRPTPSSWRGWFAAELFLLAFVLLNAKPASAQPQASEPPVPVDPTPLIELISPAEKLELGEVKDPKKAVDVYLRISDSHLDLAFSAIKANDNRRSERELDIYNKSASEATRLALEQKDSRRPLSKHIEQRLYKQIKMLESIERLFPPEREAFAQAALRNTKQLRVQALNAAFAAGDVLKDPDEGKKPEASTQRKSGHSEAAGWASFHLTRAVRSFYAHPITRTTDSAQLPGDYLTDEEDNHVREAQSPDERTKVFMKIADRRLALITGTGPKPVEKQSDSARGDKPRDARAERKAQQKAEEQEREWGQLPTLKRTELLRHYAHAVEECMAKLEDAYERNPKSAAFAKALTTLRESTDRQLAILRSLPAQPDDEDDNRALADAIAQAETANKGARGGLTPK